MRKSELAGYTAVIVLLILVLGGKTFFYIGSATEVTFTVLSTEVKGTGSGKDYKEKYLISTKLDNGDTEVFESTDTLMFGKFNSSDVYFELKNNIGARYHAKVAGWRLPFFSAYRNIITVKKVE